MLKFAENSRLSDVAGPHGWDPARPLAAKDIAALLLFFAAPQEMSGRLALTSLPRLAQLGLVERDGLSGRVTDAGVAAIERIFSGAPLVGGDGGLGGGITSEARKTAQDQEAEARRERIANARDDNPLPWRIRPIDPHRDGADQGCLGRHANHVVVDANDRPLFARDAGSGIGGPVTRSLGLWEMLLEAVNA